MEKDREAFEAWWSATRKNVSMPECLDRYWDAPGEEYSAPITQHSWVAWQAALAYARGEREEKRTRAEGPETEAVVERDGFFLTLSWVKKGREYAVRLYEPQMMECSPALADVLALAVEETAKPRTIHPINYQPSVKEG